MWSIVIDRSLVIDRHRVLLRRAWTSGWIALLLLVVPGTVFAQALHWSPVTGAEAYRVHWSNDPWLWPMCQYQQTTSTQTAEIAPQPAPGKVVFYNVIAIAPTVYRYGNWDHGELVGCLAAAEDAPAPPLLPDLKLDSP